ncbi:MAG TPA: GNAT family N-acetyltransferase [Solirubrobacteraceae bacterium]|nr:GNAT family N-acetyltransferase [Solirubrobacteraceae bacterium]
MMPLDIVALDAQRVPALRRFLDALPDGDVTFIKEDVRDPGVAEAWARGPGGLRTWVAVDGPDTVAGIVSVRPLVGWSSHVGELRLVVDPARRGRGVGRALARHALRAALAAGLEKVVVEVVAEQEGAVRMFSDLGFRGEALLRDHIRDRSGALRDLLVLAHDAREEWSSLASVGVDDELA